MTHKEHSTTPGDNPLDPADVYEVLESECVYAGRVARVRWDQVRMPAGNVATREVVEVPDAVAVVAIDDGGAVCLIHQYRHAQRSFVWELPAGRMDSENEAPLDTARRELVEEARLVSDSWTLLSIVMSSVGFTTERIHVFLAEHVRPASMQVAFRARNEEAAMRVMLRPIQEVIEEIESGMIGDAKTIVGLLLATLRRSR